MLRALTMRKHKMLKLSQDYAFIVNANNGGMKKKKKKISYVGP